MQGRIRLLKNGKATILNPSGDGVLELELSEGQEVLLYTGEKVPDVMVAPVGAQPKNCNTWGCTTP